ncbi:MAG TPA: HEAT repeat domain-containing protein [Terriglobales bacterium]|nr:HEAT repeat domain-containing protein [Terriglobales bacterium]
MRAQYYANYNEAVDNPERQRLIRRAIELNTMELDATDVEHRVREVCKEWLIEAKVDVDRLLSHKDWRVRSAALDIVWWGLGATDGIERTMEILLRDDNEDVRSYAALVLYEVSHGTLKQPEALAAFRTIIEDPKAPEFLREQAITYCAKLLAQPAFP